MNSRNLSSGCKVYSPKKKASRKQKAIKMVNSYKNDDGTRKETSIEKKVREWLESEGIYYTQEYFIKWGRKWKAFDFFVTDGINYSFLIECDGWFHGINKNGEYLEDNDLCYTQRKNRKNDRLKNRIAKMRGIPLIRLTEFDINNDIKKVKEIIFNEIKRQQGII